MTSSVCRYCHLPITHDGLVWVDTTEGDVCMNDDGDQVTHMPVDLLTDGQARRVASEWHGGGTSALASFATTGAIDNDHRLRGEILAETFSAQTEYGRRDLRALDKYVASKGRGRDPVPGWSNVWDEAIVHPSQAVPGWWVRILRDDRKNMSLGPYPSPEDAAQAMEHSLLVESECQESATDCYIAAATQDGDEVVLIDLNDPDHTGK